MLGSPCNPCCTECNCAPETSPPETVTVSFSGLTNTVRGPDLISLAFSAPWGNGAAGSVKEQGGEPGPITSVQLTSGGAGYAVFGRQAPTLVVSGGTGSGLVCSWSFSANNPTALVTWSAASGTVTSGGSGFVDGEAISFSANESAVTISDGEATVQTARAAPVATLEAAGSGTGASLSPTYTQGIGPSGRAVWSITAITVVDGGSGYENDSFVFLNITDGYAEASEFFLGQVAADEDGVITGVTIENGGLLYRDTGVVESLSITDGGEFYEENPELPPIVATVTVTAVQPPGSTGSGASLAATVDTDTTSSTFGQVTSVTVSSGGTGYLAWDWITGPCCETTYDGKSFVLRRVDTAGSCCYEYNSCGLTVNASLAPVSASVGKEFFRCPWSIDGYAESCGSFVASSESVGNCDEVSFTMENDRGVTATITAGGEYVEGSWPVNPASATFSFGGSTQGGTRIDPGTLIPSSPSDFTRNEYPFNDDGYGEGSLCAPTSSVVYADDSIGLGTNVTVSASFIGTTTHEFPEIHPCGDYFQAIVAHTCPCRYSAMVAVNELLSTGVWDDPNEDPDTRDPLRRRYAAWRASVWDGGISESADGWPGSGDFQWTLVSCTIEFRSSAAAWPYETWTPTGGTLLDPWPIFDALNPPDPATFQGAQFAGLSSRAGLPGGYASPGTPDGKVSWTIVQ